ncbi:MAG: hypothetical protein WC271_15890 [Bacteroidales bacterium]|nr:hypothetical protein [Bacteroidales bacterium]MDD4178375.1 hypothetical protein [Bacteroidales bacterium]MDD4742868.1 hypothetical protein [Bacteroidales bacterium]
MASSLSMVAIFESLMSDSFLSPFLTEGFKTMSVSSFHFSCVEIKAKVKSISPSTSTRADRLVLPDKSVKGTE